MEEWRGKREESRRKEPDCWRKARELTFGLTCVIEDNYPELAAEAVELRKKAIGTGQFVGGLIEIEAELGKLSPDELRRLPHPP